MKRNSKVMTILIYGLVCYILGSFAWDGIRQIGSGKSLPLMFHHMIKQTSPSVCYIEQKNKMKPSDKQVALQVFEYLLGSPSVQYVQKKKNPHIASELNIRCIQDTDVSSYLELKMEEIKEEQGTQENQQDIQDEGQTKHQQKGQQGEQEQGQQGQGQQEQGQQGQQGQQQDENGQEQSDKQQPSGEQKDTSGVQTIETGGNITGLKPYDGNGITYEFLMHHYYTVVSSTTLRSDDLNPEELLGMDMKMQTQKDKPQILIYHTHGQEGFADSIKGDQNTGIIGVGNYLTQLLTEQYGYHVIHITDSFDYVNGVFDRHKAYDYAYERIAQILAENPSIEVVIDLHRDGVGENTHLVTQVNGKPTAKIMFFNGISRLNDIGEIGYLYNPYRKDNLAFSLKMKLTAEANFPEFTRRNYIQAYQYNLHLRPKSTLIEAGAQTNTFEEVKNAMEPLAGILHQVLTQG